MSAKRRSKVLQNNTFDLYYAIIGLDKTNYFLSFVEWPLKTGFMGIQFEKLKKIKDFDRRTHTVKTGSGKGKQNYF